MSIKRKIVNWVLSVLFLALSVYIIGWRWSEVQGNLEASFVWAVPAFVVSHSVLHKKIDKATSSNNS